MKLILGPNDARRLGLQEGDTYETADHVDGGLGLLVDGHVVIFEPEDSDAIDAAPLDKRGAT